MRPVDELYWASIAADKEYSRVIEWRYNGRRTRWTMSEEERNDPTVMAALLDKINTFNAWEAAAREQVK